MEHRTELLVNLNTAIEEILSENDDYKNEMDLNIQFEFERPFLETQAMISECAELLYEKSPQTGIVKVYEQGSNCKDRYTSCSYGSYFFDQLELDLLSTDSDYEFTCLIN